MFLITILLSLTSHAQYKFHYGDNVMVHSSVWHQPCYDDEFVNICGKIGTVIAVETAKYSEGYVYTVKFDFKDLCSIIKTYHEVHLIRK
jgi:hypothetical protein